MARLPQACTSSPAGTMRMPECAARGGRGHGCHCVGTHLHTPDTHTHTLLELHWQRIKEAAGRRPGSSQLQVKRLKAPQSHYICRAQRAGGAGAPPCLLSPRCGMSLEGSTCSNQCGPGTKQKTLLFICVFAQKVWLFFLLYVRLCRGFYSGPVSGVCFFTQCLCEFSLSSHTVEKPACEVNKKL